MSDPPIRLPKPRKPRSGCSIAILSSIVGGLVVAVLVAIGSSWKATFDECAKTERDLRAEYAGLSWELYQREARIGAELGQSKTIADLETRLKEPYHDNSKYKDKSLSELRLQFTINQDQLRIVEGSETYGKSLSELDQKIKQLPRYAELQEIISGGSVPSTLHDDSLKDLAVVMWAILNRDKLTLFLNPLRVYYDETCTFKNITYNLLDLNKLVYHGTLRTFTDTEKKFLEWQKTHPDSN
jgi:hypothetical protein